MKKKQRLSVCQKENKDGKLPFFIYKLTLKFLAMKFYNLHFPSEKTNNLHKLQEITTKN
jgi:hypothetical protein